MPDLLVIRIDDAGDATLATGDGEVLAAGALSRPLPPFGDGPAGDAGEQLRETMLGEFQPGAGRITRIGDYLYELLAAAGVGAAWQKARTTAPDALTLLDIRPLDLARLPWELLTDAGRPAAFPVAGLARGRLPLAPAPGDVEVPLRVLVAVGSIEPEVAAGDEVAAILRALADHPWRAHAEVLIEPDKAEFYRRVDELRPHVLHFIGHGHYSPGTTTPVLDFRHPDGGEGWELSGQDIRSGLLTWMPRVLVLNACRSGQAAGQDGVWGLVEASSRADASAVVCMQGLVDSKVAIRFSDVFYRGLNNGQRVDVAVAEARRAIAQAFGMDRRDWGMPVLHLAVPPAAALPVACGLTDQQRDRIAAIPEFRKVRQLVDRDLQRWELGQAAEGLVAISGPGHAGRSSLAFSALLSRAGRGHEVRYTDLAHDRRMSWIDVLYAVRDGTSSSSALRAPLPAEAFADFNREIERLASGEEPRDGDPIPAVPPRPRFMAGTEHALDFAQRIADRFAEALIRAAGDRPLTIALDHLGGVSQGGVLAEEVTGQLCPLLLARAARGELGPVRLLLVLRDEEHDLLTPDVRQLMRHIPVPGFRRRLYPFFQREQYARAGHPDDGWARFVPLVKAMDKLLPDPWFPDRFRTFNDVVRDAPP
ncbi:CHAT domain-containing protein [Actinoplanes sp. CA-054009]